MCLYNFTPCSASSPTDLLDLLRDPPPEVVFAGLVRCNWYEAVASREQSKNNSNTLHRQSSLSRDASQRIRFLDGAQICPYVVIRHDEDDEYSAGNVIERITEAVLLDGLRKHERGCSSCWDLVVVRRWEGRPPSEAEKLEYLYTTSRRAAPSPIDSRLNAFQTQINEADQTKERKRKRADDDSMDSPAREGVDIGNLEDEEVLWETDNEASCRGDDDTSTPDDQIHGEEVMTMPAPPWAINNSQSTDYTIEPVGNFLNWNPGTDRLFRRVTALPIDNTWEAKQDTATKASPSLDETRIKMDAGSKDRSWTTKCDRSEPRSPKVSTIQHRGIVANGFPVDSDSLMTRLFCEQCGKKFIKWHRNKRGPTGGFMCFPCSNRAPKAEVPNPAATAKAVWRDVQSAPPSNAHLHFSHGQPGVAKRTAEADAKQEHILDRHQAAKSSSDTRQSAERKPSSESTKTKSSQGATHTDSNVRDDKLARLRQESQRLRSQLRDAQRREIELLTELEELKNTTVTYEEDDQNNDTDDNATRKTRRSSGGSDEDDGSEAEEDDLDDDDEDEASDEEEDECLRDWTWQDEVSDKECELHLEEHGDRWICPQHHRHRVLNTARECVRRLINERKS